MKRKYMILLVSILMFVFSSCSVQPAPVQPAPVQSEVTEYHIVYELDGGVNHPDNPAEYSDFDLPIAIHSPTKENYVFVGWTSEILGIDTPNENVVIPSGAEGDITLSAVWIDSDLVQYEDNDAPTKGPMVFDFAELSEEDFPRGTWTANQLIAKYGTPKELRIHYVQYYLTAYVIMEFENVRIVFDYIEPAKFSFYSESAEPGNYALTEKDKNLECKIFRVTTSDTDVELPYGIKIGQSTKSQILEIYPARTEAEGENYIVYDYAFCDENGVMPDYGSSNDIGMLDYSFDENGVLFQVEISWWYTDI